MKDERVDLQHVRDAIDGRERFDADTMAQDADFRNLGIIGEAVQQIPQSTRGRVPDMPWKQIAGMRDVPIHHYLGVKLETVWEVVERHLSPLRVAVEDLLTISTDEE